MKSTRSMRTLLTAATLALGGAAVAAAEWPAWMEGLFFNAEERTASAMAAEKKGEVALDALETALRLDPDDPVAMYNAGTARLQAGAGDAAAPLEKAAAADAPDLGASAHYNLGNARLRAKDYEGAVKSFEEALRRTPGAVDAQYNLELARRLLELQQQQQQQQGEDGDKKQDQDQQKDDQQQKDQEQKDQQQKDQQQQDPQKDQQQKDDQQQDQQGKDQEQQDQQDQQGQQDPQNQQEQQGPLPQFRDLPDMSAEEAAAILEAIENMERERRQEEMLEKARKATRGKKDW